MKNKYWILVLVVLIWLAACTPGNEITPDSSTLSTTDPLETSSTGILPEATFTVDPVTSFGLTYVLEEEKLALDVYLFLFDKWGSRVFQNIAYSEQTHTDAIRDLLDIYNLPDPAIGLLPGQFSDPVLQTLYDDLTSRGTLGLSDAFKVAASIEEIDILDLQTRLDGDLPADIRQVYENLLSGSYNHLFAFTSILERQTGEIYTPEYMDPDAYQEAIDLASTTGHGESGGGGYYGGTQTP